MLKELYDKNYTSLTEGLCRQVLKTNRLSYSAFYLLAHSRYLKKDYKTAMALLKKALSYKPDFVEALNLMGLVFIEDKQFDKAEECLRYALKLRANYAPSYCNLGLALKSQGKINHAIRCYQKAIKLNSNYTEAYNNLAVAYFESGSLDKAIEALQTAVIKNPNYPPSYCNLGNLVRVKGYPDLALQYYEKALELDDQYVDAKWNMALCYLQLGDFRLGFELYEQRRLLPEYNPVLKDLDARLQYQGQSAPQKRLLLYTEQGFGDSIQFVRFVSSIRPKVAQVILCCQRELVRLFKCLSGITQVVSADEPLPEYDMHCSLMSLPFVLRDELTISGRPYIQVPDGLNDVVRILNRGRFKVGLVLNARHPANKSISIDTFGPVLDVAEDVCFYLMQNPVGIDCLRFTNLIDISDALKDFLDTAVALKHLDLLISVDTATLHLAGAMGMRAFGLLPFASDWRWGGNLDKTSWYESIRIFRQSSYNDWSKPLQQLKGELKKVLKEV